MTLLDHLRELVRPARLPEVCHESERPTPPPGEFPPDDDLLPWFPPQSRIPSDLRRR